MTNISSLLLSVKFLFLFASTVLGQAASPASSIVSGAITSPPSQCSSKCSSFSLASCAVTSVPTTNAQWATTCGLMADCICPILSKNGACETCLVGNTDTVPASTYWGLLQGACTTNTAAPQICQLFNVSISANIQGATNVTSTASSGSTSTLLPPPAQTKKSGEERVHITAALAIALVASVFMV